MLILKNLRLRRLTLMAVLYVDEYGAVVRYSAGLVLVEKEGCPISSVRVQDIESVVIEENALLTSAAIAAFLNEGVDVAFLNGRGEYIGKIESALKKDITLRRRQYSLSEDVDFCTGLAKRFVASKLANMRTIVLRYARKQEPDRLTEIAGRIKEAAVLAGAADSIDAIRGFEGVGSKEYFSALGLIISEPFQFAGRNRRPPKDPVNAMLSFAYALLENYVERAVSIAGLDPYCGFFHREAYGRQGLVLDLMEEFRPVIADSVVILCCNQHRLKPDQDFEDVEGGVYLNESGRQKLFEAFERRMKENVKTYSGSCVNYARVCVEQARLIAKCIRNGKPDYKPFLVR
jgi:CRISPR-associated protein Cas1